MAVNNDSSVHPISLAASESDIISILNHNFQVLTERIKAVNIQLSYLDVLKIATIFKAATPNPVSKPNPLDPSEKAEDESQEAYEARVNAYNQAMADYTAYLSVLDDNLQRFVSSCWNTLANYSGVYISCETAGVTLFTWMNTYQVKNGDFIVKLPNNQSLYLPGADPTYMVPQETFSVASSEINFVTSTSATAAVSVGSISFPEYVSSGLHYTTTTVSAGATIPYPDSNLYTLRDVRFFVNGGEDDGQEVFFVKRLTEAPIDLRVQEFFGNK